MLHMIVEQTHQYQKRMEYVSGNFVETESDSLMYVRGFRQPYGWIKESGMPPQPHWDVILMSDGEFELGTELPVKIIGLFFRNDNDHKYVAVEESRAIEDLSELSEEELEDLHRLYPRAREGEGWFGREMAEKAMRECEKAL